MKDLKERYTPLAAKYKLPQFEELDNDFELLYMREICEITYPLRFIRRRINDKFSWVCNMIQALLQPNPQSMISLRETSFFTKEQKEDLHKILKDLMALERKSLSYDIESNEKEDAAFITESVHHWNTIKDKLKDIATTLKEGWTKEIEKKNNNNYFG